MAYGAPIDISDALTLAGISPRPKERNTFAFLGDSRMDQVYSAGGTAALPMTSKASWHWFNVANALLGQRMIDVGNFAVSGLRSDQYLSGVTKNGVAYASALASAIATGAANIVIFGTVNDITAGNYDPFLTRYAPSVPSIKEACDQIIAAGARPILVTEPGAGTFSGVTAAKAAVVRYNQLVRQYCYENGDAILFDLAAVTLDPTSAAMAFKSGYGFDSVHYEIPAGFAQGQAFALLMSGLVPSFGHLTTSALEVPANGSIQLLPNPLFLTTTGGTAGTGITGTVPSGVSAACAGSVTAALSTAAGSHGNDLVIAATATGAGSVGLTFDLTGSSYDQPGASFTASCQALVQSGATGMQPPALLVESRRNGASNTACDMNSVGHTGVMPATADTTMTLKTPVLVVNSDTPRNWFLVKLTLPFVSAGSATVKFSRLGLLARQV